MPAKTYGAGVHKMVINEGLSRLLFHIQVDTIASGSIFRS